MSKSIEMNSLLSLDLGNYDTVTTRKKRMIKCFINGHDWEVRDLKCLSLYKCLRCNKRDWSGIPDHEYTLREDEPDDGSN